MSWYKKTNPRLGPKSTWYILNTKQKLSFQYWNWCHYNTVQIHVVQWRNWYTYYADTRIYTYYADTRIYTYYADTRIYTYYADTLIYTLCTSCKKCKINQMLNRNPKGHIGHFIDYNCGRYFIKNAVFNAWKQVTSVSYWSTVNTTIFSKKY